MPSPRSRHRRRTNRQCAPPGTQNPYRRLHRSSPTSRTSSAGTDRHRTDTRAHSANSPLHRTSRTQSSRSGAYCSTHSAPAKRAHRNIHKKWGEGSQTPTPLFFGILEAELLVKPPHQHSRPRRTMHTLGCTSNTRARIVKAKRPHAPTRGALRATNPTKGTTPMSRTAGLHGVNFHRRAARTKVRPPRTGRPHRPCAAHRRPARRLLRPHLPALFRRARPRRSPTFDGVEVVTSH